MDETSVVVEEKTEILRVPIITASQKPKTLPVEEVPLQPFVQWIKVLSKKKLSTVQIRRMIRGGNVWINGVAVKELGHAIQRGDMIQVAQRFFGKVI